MMMNKKQTLRKLSLYALHIFILVNFAVAQPLFDLLSRNAAFFVAHKSGPLDVFVLFFVICLLIPLVFSGIEFIAACFGNRLLNAVHGVITCFLLTLILLPLFKKADVSWAFVLSLALAAALILTAVYFRYRPSRVFLSLLSPSLILFPVLFFFNDSVAKIVFPEEEVRALGGEAGNPVPVVMVVFDELTLFSLMDERGDIDQSRYPNFSALAERSHWYRNATSVSNHTVLALPAIVTGKYPDFSKLPILSDIPENLFTLLNGQYALKVSEPMTGLSPETRHADEKRVDTKKLALLCADVSVVFLHITVPDDLRHFLPDISKGWKNFAAGGDNFIRKAVARFNEASENVTDRFDDFLKEIKLTEKPTFYFLHIMLPHRPWVYTPTGKKYRLYGFDKVFFDEKDKSNSTWVHNGALVREAYKRYGYQLSYTDKLLGRLVDRLKDEGIYDSSLLIIMADHGISFCPGEKIRVATGVTYEDIMRMPLFIKLPHQEKAIVDDRNIETIDVLPTIADVLDKDVPWVMDGKSALDVSLPEREVKKIYNVEQKNILCFMTDCDEGTGCMKWREEAGAFWTPGKKLLSDPYGELAGRRISSSSISESGRYRCRIDNDSLYNDVRHDGSWMPCNITGKVFSSEQIETPIQIAVTVNDVIVATTETYGNGKDVKEVRFMSVVPEESFRNGENHVDIFLISNEKQKNPPLVKIPGEDVVTYALLPSGREIAVQPGGRIIPLIKNPGSGYLDVAALKDGCFRIAGWAIDTDNKVHVEKIVVFMNDRYVYSGITNVHRVDISDKHPEMTRAGFDFFLPGSIVRDPGNDELRLFALRKDNVAFELIYYGKYQWKM